MFYFGDPEQSAALYLDSVVLDNGGPGMPEKHPDEMSLEELQWANTYLTIAWRQGMGEGLAQEVLDALERAHEPIFVTLLQQSRKFRKFVLAKKTPHMPVGGKSFAEARKKAQRLAKTVRAW